MSATQNPPAHSTQIFLGRQPILDREQKLYAYKLLFRDGKQATGNHADITDPTQATATVIANAFTELTTHNALGHYRGVIDIDHDLLFSETLEALPSQLVALEIVGNIAPTGEVVARCRQLRERGFTLVMNGSIGNAPGSVADLDTDYRPLLALADLIKVDIVHTDAERLPALVAELKPLARTLLAEKVESLAQFMQCKKLGFDLFQGYYFAKPTVIVGKKLNSSQLSLVRLLNLILEDAETSVLENAFKLEPALTVNMLRLTNSVSCGLSIKITSLRHAITMLGRQPLQRWLQLLVYTATPGAPLGGTPLLQLAATRGRLMEKLAERSHGRNRDLTEQAFMVGIISLMPALLGIAMDQLLEQLPVAQRVKQALLCYGGALGQLLHLVEATEQPDPNALEEALHRLPAISADYLGHSLAEGLAWANQLAEENATPA